MRSGSTTLTTTKNKLGGSSWLFPITANSKKKSPVLPSPSTGAAEPKQLPAGSEVKARIVSIRTGISDKNDCTWRSVVYDVPAEPMVTEFNDFMWDLDKEKLTPKQFARELYKFKQFASAFGIDFSRPFSWEDDLPGKEGWIIVGVKKSDEYGDQNTVKKYIAKK